jgi:hypothetical protein
MESEVLLLLNEKYSAGFCSASEKPALFFYRTIRGAQAAGKSSYSPTESTGNISQN